ncbi:MAG: S8 family serine peptidase [Actinomycetota bacterium]|nr:S8 family serine peptidase [Actinomycetota bacterium]
MKRAVIFLTLILLLPATPAEASSRVPVIVMTTRRLSGADFRAMHVAVGEFDVRAQWSVIDGFATALTERQIALLRDRDEVVKIEPDEVVHATMSTARKWEGVDTAVSDFGVTGDRSGNRKSFTKADIVACVIDTGIDTGHTDLDEGEVIGWKDFVNGRSAPYDDNGHGSHVAGILAGQGDASWSMRGVAYGAALVGVKALGNTGAGTTTAIINAVNFCVNNKATYNIRIMSMSLGGSTPSDGTDALSVAVNNAYSAGILPVVAAGNAGPDTHTVGSPAAAANALTVCSLGDPGEKGFFVSEFSSRGPTLDGRTKPDICAPGDRITSVAAGTGNGYTSKSGTSMATPFVAGVAALMLDANPALSASSLKSKIIATAEDWRSPGADWDTGRGRLQAYEALKSAGSLTGAGPAVPNHYKLDAQSLATEGAEERWSFGVSSTAYPVAITLIMSTASASHDFDLYLYGPTGVVLASSTGTSRQETIGFQPTVTGTYRAGIRSYAGTGTYYADFSFGGSAPVLFASG